MRSPTRVSLAFLTLLSLAVAAVPAMLLPTASAYCSTQTPVDCVEEAPDVIQQALVVVGENCGDRASCARFLASIAAQVACGNGCTLVGTGNDPDGSTTVYYMSCHYDYYYEELVCTRADDIAKTPTKDDVPPVPSPPPVSVPPVPTLPPIPSLPPVPTLPPVPGAPPTCYAHNPEAVSNLCVATGSESTSVTHPTVVLRPVCLVGYEYCYPLPAPGSTTTTVAVPTVDGYVEVTYACGAGVPCRVTLP